MEHCTQKRKIKVIVGFDSADELKCVVSTLCCPEIYAYTRKRDGKVILNSILKEKPDVVIMYTTMPNFDALSIIKKTKDLPNRPAYIVISTYVNDVVEYEVMSTKRAYFIQIPYDEEDLKDRIFSLMEMEQNHLPYIEKNEKDEKELYLRVTNILQHTGISANLKGYKNLQIGILLAIKHPEYVSHVIRQLYPKIA